MVKVSLVLQPGAAARTPTKKLDSRLVVSFRPFWRLVLGGERERERGRQAGRQRQTDRQTDRQTGEERQAERDKERKREKETDRNTK